MPFSLLDQQVGANLQLHRVRLGMSRQECACRLSVTVDRVSQWEEGLLQISPNDMWLMKIRIGLDPSDLLGGMTFESDSLD